MFGLSSSAHFPNVILPDERCTEGVLPVWISGFCFGAWGKLTTLENTLCLAWLLCSCAGISPDFRVPLIFAPALLEFPWLLFLVYKTFMWTGCWENGAGWSLILFQTEVWSSLSLGKGGGLGTTTYSMPGTVQTSDKDLILCGPITHIWRCCTSENDTGSWSNIFSPTTK